MRLPSISTKSVLLFFKMQEKEKKEKQKSTQFKIETIMV